MLQANDRVIYHGRPGHVYMIRPAATLTLEHTGQKINLPAAYKVRFGNREYSEWLEEGDLVRVEEAQNSQEGR